MLCIVYVCVIAASVRVVVTNVTEGRNDYAEIFNSMSLHSGCDRQLVLVFFSGFFYLMS